MTPTTCEGSKCSTGKPKPVTLVATVIPRKRPVQPARRFPATRPPATTRPARSPRRLIATWKTVNVVIPEAKEGSFHKATGRMRAGTHIPPASRRGKLTKVEWAPNLRFRVAVPDHDS